MFCDVLKRLRKERGLTQQELAKRLKISGSAVAMYESGKRRPDHDLMVEIADFFEVDLNFLYERKSRSDTDELREGVLIFHRDGKNVKKHFTEEQMKILQALIDAMPESEEQQ